MTISAGDRVVLNAPWPVAPGSSVSLEPGDEGTVRNVSRTYCAVEIQGFLVVVPTSRPDVVAEGTPRGVALEPDDRGDDWWDDVDDRLGRSDRRG